MPSLETKKQSTSGLAENPRWQPEMSAKTLRSQYIADRFTDHYTIFTEASLNHEAQLNSISVRTKIQVDRRK